MFFECFIEYSSKLFCSTYLVKVYSIISVKFSPPIILLSDSLGFPE